MVFLFSRMNIWPWEAVSQIANTSPISGFRDSSLFWNYFHHVLYFFIGNLKKTEQENKERLWWIGDLLIASYWFCSCYFLFCFFFFSKTTFSSACLFCICFFFLLCRFISCLIFMTFSSGNMFGFFMFYDSLLPLFVFIHSHAKFSQYVRSL